MPWTTEVFGDDWIIRLYEEIAAGYVRTQTHPKDPCLMIYNYTEKAVFDKHWNDVTLNTRGLILAVHDGLEYSIQARPFKKFFNHGEPGAAQISINDPVEVTDKIDGSLGISYLDPDGKIAIATRGSFASDQALHATEFLRRNPEYEDWMARVDRTEFTVLVEIVYPENRIVVDYGDEEELVLLGIRDMRTGQSVGPQFLKSYPGRRSQTFEYATMSDALAAPPRPGREGLVVRKAETEDRVKLKQEEYVRLHKIVTNLNERAVWEILKDRTQDTWAWIAQLPDEFHDWATQVAHDLRQQYKELDEQIEAEYERINVFLRGTVHLDPSSRRDFAGLAKTTQYPWAMFARLDGKDCSDKIWQLIRPEAHKGPHGKQVDNEEL